MRDDEQGQGGDEHTPAEKQLNEDLLRLHFDIMTSEVDDAVEEGTVPPSVEAWKSVQAAASGDAADTPFGAADGGASHGASHGGASGGASGDVPGDISGSPRATDDARAGEVRDKASRRRLRIALLAAAVLLALLAISPIGGIAKDLILRKMMSAPVVIPPGAPMEPKAGAQRANRLGIWSRSVPDILFPLDDKAARKLIGDKPKLIEPAPANYSPFAMMGSTESDIEMTLDAKALDILLFRVLTDDVTADVTGLEGRKLRIHYAPAVRTIYLPMGEPLTEKIVFKSIIVDQSDTPRLDIPGPLSREVIREAIAPFLPAELRTQITEPAWPTGLPVPPPGVEGFKLIKAASDGDVTILRWRLEHLNAAHGLSFPMEGEEEIVTAVRVSDGQVHSVSAFARGPFSRSDIVDMVRRIR